jgi:hypothetical protein
MRLVRIIPAALILLVWGASAFAQEWIEYVDRKEFFQINFPGQPAVKDISYKTENGETVPAKVYTAKEGPATYVLTVVNYKGGEAGDYRGSTAWAAWNFRKRGGVVTYDAYAQTDRIIGHQLQITNPDKSRSYIGIHPNMRRLYIMEATAPPDYPPPSDFPQTISLLDEQGRRIRYNLDDEGNRVGRNEDQRRLYETLP